MAQKKARLFLGNLPQQSSESNVQQRLQMYGTVNSVEIKHKKEFGNDTIASTFAYVNLETDESTLQQCLRDLRNKDWDGSYIKAELAKESFLDRLKREREQASKPNSEQRTEKLPDPPKNSSTSLRSFPAKEEYFSRKRKSSFNEDPADICEEEKLVSRLESFSDFWKDDPPARHAQSPIKVKNLEHSNTRYFLKEHYSRSKSSYANDCVNRPVKNSDSFTAKLQIDANTNALPDTEKNLAAQAAEQKRLKALEEKSKALQQQKNTIKNALSSIDHAKPSNKIIFDDDGDPVSTSEMQPKAAMNNQGKKSDKSKAYSGEKGQQTSKSNGQLQLFGGEDDDNDNWQGDFRFKKQFEGKKGRQLLEMQARFKDDERFVMDERFYESDGEKEEVEEPSAPATEEERALLEEKAKEMEILASVLGEPMQPSVSKKTTFNPMVRFDPLKPSHAKFELPKPNNPKVKLGDIDQKQKFGDKTERERIEYVPLPVDESQSFKVATNIKELFKKNEKGVQSTETTTFSLRQMFSTEHDEPTHNAEDPESKPASPQPKPRPEIKPVLRGFQDSKPLAMFTKKLLRPELNGLTNTFCKDVDVEAIKEKFSGKRRFLGRMLHKKKIVLERQQHFKQKIGAASLAQKALDRESAIRRKSVKPWEKKRGRR